MSAPSEHNQLCLQIIRVLYRLFLRISRYARIAPLRVGLHCLKIRRGFCVRVVLL